MYRLVGTRVDLSQAGAPILRGLLSAINPPFSEQSNCLEFSFRSTQQDAFAGKVLIPTVYMSKRADDGSKWIALRRLSDEVPFRIFIEFVGFSLLRRSSPLR